MTASGIQTVGLEKRYRKTQALAGVDLHLPEGSVALLVGPNGAGKTTLLKVLMDLIPFEGGEVEVLGLDPREQGARIRAAAGFLPEEIHFPFEGMKVRDVLAFHSRFRPQWDREYAQELSEALELRMDQPWKKLSKGESRRVQLACALSHRPPLLLLDEPTDGLDPLVRERVLGLLAEHLAETGATTLYCTHVLHEAQGLADRLVVLKEGRVRLDADVETLRAEHLRVRLRPGTGTPERPPFHLRDEAGGMGELRWTVRAFEFELRGWAAACGVELVEVTPAPLGDIALAHLANTAPAQEVTHV